MAPRKPRRAIRLGTVISVAAGLGTLFVLMVPPWHAPVAGHQLGYRASSMIQFDQTAPAAFTFDKPPASFDATHYGVDPAALNDTRPAAAVYKGLKVTTGGTAGQFMALQVAITNWVAPLQGCAFCHQGNDWASDAKPQKQAARVMTQMVQTLNTDWRGHVGDAGVTCYTCHRGQNVPAAVWYPRAVKPPKPFVAKQEDWLQSATTVRDFFPDAGFSEYLLQDTPGHSQSYTALPTTGPVESVVVKRLYEVMMQMSDGIGVNCGYCHNSRAFFDWGQSTPARWAGLQGIHMTQAINNDFLLPLGAAMPQLREIHHNGRLPITPAAEANPQNGNALATCQTCHYQQPKPLAGLNLAAGYPALTAPVTGAAK
jgi:photosynthetic reaction center cytochrome c subunit